MRPAHDRLGRAAEQQHAAKLDDVVDGRSRNLVVEDDVIRRHLELRAARLEHRKRGRALHRVGPRDAPDGALLGRQLQLRQRRDGALERRRLGRPLLLLLPRLLLKERPRRQPAGTVVGGLERQPVRAARHVAHAAPARPPGRRRCCCSCCWRRLLLAKHASLLLLPALHLQRPHAGRQLRRRRAAALRRGEGPQHLQWPLLCCACRPRRVLLAAAEGYLNDGSPDERRETAAGAPQREGPGWLAARSVAQAVSANWVAQSPWHTEQ